MLAVFTRDSLASESSELYAAGQVVDLSPASYDRWVRRGAVVAAPPEVSQIDADAPAEPTESNPPAARKPRRAKRRSKKQ